MEDDCEIIEGMCVGGGKNLIYGAQQSFSLRK